MTHKLLRIAIENLIGNAWTFTRQRRNSRIEFGTTQQDNRAVYYVRDNGRGFRQEDADRLLSLFSTAHPEAKHEGTGVGLATVAQVVRRHGGSVWDEG